MYGIEKRTLTPHQKEQILERDGYICVYCLAEATEVDHVIPFCYSQCDDPDNLVSCCETCNDIASGRIFNNFDEKFNYIKAVREGRKWSKKLKRLSPSECIECHRLFKPRCKGSTLFLCSDCAKEF